MFGFGVMNKTVKELRKNRCLTAKELAQRLKVDTIEILRIEEVKLKDVPEPLKSKITPILRGDETDKIPWL
ncbi:transcriptional regulator [Heliobacterium chlorum]|uniref:Transcriptional regulator n=1 Tax=Heliobacterium chlorum TaxID=2698 RepID=A0ABR7T3Z0_HELCL|nr:transcriptional regulator [Heliobacterium chlorum]MBC9784822.1 transcriptional regulator [Heliobacterium chlorum]